jgi:uncharacterized membrane protein YdfJ with MMPL/SSD domain
MNDKPTETETARPISPTDARQGEKRGMKRILFLSIALTIIMLVAVFGIFAR